MNSAHIEAAIRRRHKKDITLSQMKNGPTIQGVSIIDVWCMSPTWKEDITGYEIKISRSDFVSDEKWHNYLQMCNKFVWACPWGMIHPEEIHQAAGLLWVKDDGTARLVKKPLFRNAEIPKDIYRYMMFWKLNWSRQKSRGEMIDEYLADKKDGAERAILFKNRMAEEIAKERKENQRLREKIEAWDHIMQNHSPEEIHRAIAKSRLPTIGTDILMRIKLMCEAELNKGKS